MLKRLSTSEVNGIKKSIEDIIQNTDELKNKIAQNEVNQVLRCVESGQLRVISPADETAACGAVPMDGELQNWIVHGWVKESILLAMKMRVAQTYKIKLFHSAELVDAVPLDPGRVFAGEFAYHDKFDLQHNLSAKSVRSLPGSLVREGSCVSKNAILMPSFINIGAWVGEGTMIDTWATVGSCAQVGKNVHVAGGVGIGGVLEPANARPVIVGDNAFLGSRVILVEGVVVSSGAVLGANVCLTASTPIYDVTTSEKTEYRGFVPANAVVAMGTRIKTFPGGEVPLQCAYIIAYRSKKTNAKISLNDILRETGIPI